MHVVRPLLARLADWVQALGVDQLATVSDEAREHLGPLRRLATRADHQMNESEEGLYAELATTGSSAWERLQQRRHVAAQRRCHVPRRTRRAAADAGRARPGHRRRRRCPSGGLPSRDGGVADDRRARRSGDERHQRRSQRRQPAPQLGVAARCLAVRATTSAAPRSRRCRPLSWRRFPTSGVGCG